MGLCSSEFPFNFFLSYPLAPISENSVSKSLMLPNSWKLELALPVGKLVHTLYIKACLGWTDKVSQWIFRKSELVEKICKGQEGFLFCLGFFGGVLKTGKKSVKMLLLQQRSGACSSPAASMTGHSDASLLSRLRRRSRFCGPLKNTIFLDDLELESLQSICNIKIV